MVGHVCGMCGFISIDGTIPEKCPVCGAPKTAFKEKNDVKTAGDVAIYGESEKKHIPAISVSKTCGILPDGCVDVTVKIGEIPHPMLPEHFIMRIDFYLDKKFLSRVIFTPGQINAAAGLHLKAKSGKLAAIETCNIHGSWFNETDI